MSSKNDTSEIIKDFLDLWQKQFTYMSKDPETVMNSMKFFQDIQNGYLNSINKTQQNNAESDSTINTLKSINDELCKLQQRFTDIETRLSQLESRSTGLRRGNKTKVAGKKSTGVKKRVKKTAK